MVEIAIGPAIKREASILTNIKQGGETNASNKSDIYYQSLAELAICRYIGCQYKHYSR